MPKIIDMFTPEQEGILKDEFYQTTKTGFDLFQWGAGQFTANPLKAVGIVALIAFALGGFKIKIADIIDIKK